MNVLPDFISRIVIGVNNPIGIDTYIECLPYTHDFDEVIERVGVDPLKLKTLALRLMKREGVELDYDEAEEEIIKIWEAI